MVLQILSPFLCLAINAAIQVMVFRYLPKAGLLKSIYYGFSLGLFLLFCLASAGFLNSRLSASGCIWALLNSLIAYACLAYCYFHFVNLGETARRIRILRELYESKNGLSYEDILKRYNVGMIIDVRLKRLMESQQIGLMDEKYRIRKPLVLVFARAIVGLKKLLYGRQYQQFV